MMSDLSRVMDFDHVIEIKATTITDGLVVHRADLSAPEIWDGQVSDGWELLNGYSGQHGYPGPIMHDSEYIGGRMAEDILAAPGVYVAVIARYTPDEHDTEATHEQGFLEEGWAIARLTTD